MFVLGLWVDGLRTGEVLRPSATAQIPGREKGGSLVQTCALSFVVRSMALKENTDQGHGEESWVQGQSPAGWIGSRTGIEQPRE